MLKFLLQFFEVQVLMVLDIAIIIPLPDLHFLHVRCWNKQELKFKLLYA